MFINNYNINDILNYKIIYSNNNNNINNFFKENLKVLSHTYFSGNIKNNKKKKLLFKQIKQKKKLTINSSYKK